MHDNKSIMNEWSQAVTVAECICTTTMQGANHVLRLSMSANGLVNRMGGSGNRSRFLYCSACHYYTPTTYTCNHTKGRSCHRFVFVANTPIFISRNICQVLRSSLHWLTVGAAFVLLFVFTGFGCCSFLRHYYRKVSAVGFA